MKGSIVNRNGKYSIVIYMGKDSFGKKKQKWFSGYNSQKEAEKALPRLLVKIQDGELIDNNRITLGNFLNEWLKDKNIKDDLSPTTYDGYRNIIENHLVPTIGDIPLQDLKPYNLQKYFDLKVKTLSARTLNNHKRVLSSALIYADDMELIEKNPLPKVKMPREKREEVTPYTLEQCKILLDSLEENRYLGPPVVLSIFLGLRRGECLGLSWDNVDLENNTVKVVQNLEYVRKVFYLKEPKTRKSKRTLAMPQVLVDYLKEHQKWQKEMKLKSGGAWVNENNLVCTRSNGTMIIPHTLSTQFKYFLDNNKQLNLPTLRFHDLRHTNATLMLALGVSSKVAQQRLGHNNISVTLDLYSHVLESIDLEAAKKIDSAFSNAT